MKHFVVVCVCATVSTDPPAEILTCDYLHFFVFMPSYVVRKPTFPPRLNRIKQRLWDRVEEEDGPHEQQRL